MYHGINASEGIGIGKVKIIREQSLAYTPAAVEDAAAEAQRFEDALKVFTEKTMQMAEVVRKKAGEKESEILMGHVILISDPVIGAEIKNKINEGQCAEAALEAVLDTFAAMFSASGDELTAQRVTDLNDIKNGLLKVLLGVADQDLSTLEPDTVLVAKDLTPSMTASLNKDHVAGIVTETGGRTSHSAILARSLEIPAVLSIKDITSILQDGETVIVDGIEGNVLRGCDENQIAAYKRKQAAYAEEKRALAKFVGRKTQTEDDIVVELFCNIGKPEDAAKVLEHDGEGIGLFRTEFLFMDRNAVPSEEEQFSAYQKAALAMKGRPVIIRTLDIGGDKALPYLGLAQEENPFLGFRAVRFCLANPELFKTQLRALLRASAFGDIRIMLPLVTCVDELRDAKAMIQKLQAQLDQEKIQYNPKIKVGVMIETPAACLIADLLAKEADFFSIGTNDLTQYTMAVDRGNAKVAYLYSAYNPAVLRSVKNVIAAGKRAGIPVGMCGEAAADKYLIPILIAFGLDEYSVTPASVLAVRKAISQWDIKRAKEAAEHVLSLATEQEVRSYLTEILE